jgi:hypothetical protein
VHDIGTLPYHPTNPHAPTENRSDMMTTPMDGPQQKTRNINIHPTPSRSSAPPSDRTLTSHFISTLFGENAAGTRLFLIHEENPIRIRRLPQMRHRTKMKLRGEANSMLLSARRPSPLPRVGSELPTRCDEVDKMPRPLLRRTRSLNAIPNSSIRDKDKVITSAITLRRGINKKEANSSLSLTSFQSTRLISNDNGSKKRPIKNEI